MPQTTSTHNHGKAIILNDALETSRMLPIPNLFREVQEAHCGSHHDIVQMGVQRDLLAFLA